MKTEKPQDAYTVCIEETQHNNGYCWHINLPKGFETGDQPDSGGSSPYRLYEDGLELLHAHSKHNDIRIIGLGHYSHWRNELYFSSSDNTDPRLNGRIYQLKRADTKKPAHSFLTKKYNDLASISENINTLFIIGCGRSGTTILSDMLKTHPMLRATFGHPHGEDNEGWTLHAGAIISGSPTDSSLDQGKKHSNECPHMTAKDAKPENIKAMRQYYAHEILQGNLELTALNKNVHICNKIGFVKAIFPNAKFVHIIRDAVPTIASWQKIILEKNNIKLTIPDSDFPCLSIEITDLASVNQGNNHIKPSTLECLITYWKSINRDIPRQLVNFPQDLITIKYEELVTDPESHLNRICSFAGLQPIPKLPEWMTIERAPTHKNILTQADISYIREQAQSVLKQFGY